MTAPENINEDLLEEIRNDKKKGLWSPQMPVS